MKPDKLSLLTCRPRPMSPVEELRARLLGQPGVRLVPSDEFIGLLIGSRKLERRDAPGARMRGLHDRALGLTFLVEEEALLSARAG